MKTILCFILFLYLAPIKLTITYAFHKVTISHERHLYIIPGQRVPIGELSFAIVMQTSDSYKPVEAFSLNLTVFMYCGHWPSGVKNHCLRYLYKTWSVVAPVIGTVAFFFLQLMNMLLVFGDLQKFMDACGLLVTYFGLIAKLVCLRWNIKRVEGLFEKLESPIFMPRQQEHYDFMKEAMYIVKRDSVFFLSSALCVMSFWSFYPLVDSSEERQLAYEMWCPVNLNDTTIYVGLYFYQVVVAFYNAAINPLMDTTICGLMKMMTGHLDILNHDFRNIFDENFIKPGESSGNKAKMTKQDLVLGEDEKSFGTMVIPSYDWVSKKVTNEEIHLRLVACIRYYMAIENFAEELFDVFETGILIQYVTSCLIVCITSFGLTKAPLLSMQFASIIQYQGCMIIQIFIYCWRGNELSLKFSKLSDAIYCSEWIGATRSFHKSMDVIMSRLQKPVILYLAGLISLSVDTFISVIKSAYSFYMFLKEVETKG